jgi:hypothetical protein
MQQRRNCIAGRSGELTGDKGLEVFELLDDLRDQIWSRYGAAIQDELRRQRDPT